MTVIERTASGRFTWADIADEPEDGLRREIIGGALTVNPSPAGRHQFVGQRLWRVLDDQAPGDLVVVLAPYDWRYDEEGVVVPDITVCRGADFDLDGPLRAPAVPLLVVEILSPSNAGYDRLLKRELYERLGVASFWLVDPGATDREPSITALRLDDEGAYETEAEAAGDELFTTEHPFPVSFAPAELLRRRHRD